MRGAISAADKLDIAPPAVRLITKAPTVTLIGPVGPLTWEGVPPNNAARKPTITAPKRPVTYTHHTNTTKTK